ncbi:Aminoglycoside acetyltransferase regulator [Budvicia aquatica]|uniref:Aminoglycoside acetyltransferase regulator n=1 Tax=Budvicia aquatica TaxID=82979 RepID=A0A484ZDK7_9GAMM|nr:hypothetical protein [Budvicia aquatica]VFS46532.1 Aminoglycoside acetyltransferase regulator [Budvicia aquatica]
MLLKTVYVTARDRVRLTEIGQVLLSYGLQDLIRILGLNTLIGRHLKLQAPAENQPQQLRRALEALGPTFVKLGQILATRGDLLDDNWTSELEKLHSNVSTLPLGEPVRSNIGFIRGLLRKKFLLNSVPLL